MDSVRASKSRVPYITAFAVIVAVALGITSVALNIVILTKSNTINTNTNAIQSALHPVSVKTTVPSHTGIPVKGNTTSPLPTTETTASPISSTTSADNNNCQTMSPVSDSPGFKDAAQYLLSGLDESVDPCDDFYGFTCNKYLASINLGPGTSRKGTYDDAQAVVNMQIAGFLNKINASDETISLTERITKVAFDSCMHASSGFYKNISDVMYEVDDQFGGAPFAGGNLTEDLNLFKVAGYLEQNHALGTIMSSWVSVDYKNVTRNALYISQPDLSMPLDYFTKPQYIDQLIKEQDMVFSVMKDYCNSTEICDSDVTDASLLEAAQKVVQFEVLIAMSSWSDDLLRNYRQQYNPFKIVDLNKTYPNIDFSTYLQTMLEGVQKPDEVNLDEVIISTPSYFGWLDSIFDGKTVDKTTIANYMIVQMLMDTSEFWDSHMSRMAKKRNYIPYAMRKGRGVTKVGKRHVRRFDEDPVQVGCLDMLMAYMPYGPGYVYVKNLKKRHAVIADIKKQTHLVIASFQGMMKTLKWMSTDSLHMALNKSNSLYQNYGYPKSLFGDFDNFTKIDAYHQDYAAIVNLTDVYSIMKILKRGLYVREAFRLLTEEGNSFWDWDLRKNFLQSPAMVNAWYQPERNSITFPFAIWNPPYYRIDFPQAYNFAGQGGTGGHELTHGFDDEGVQFDWDGSMTYCDGKNSSSQAYKCGWMDDNSSDGFTDMAQCVVSQYSSQCCPLKTGNVHCANGATTQGENIADLGGQQAAYKAYRQWVEDNKKEEDRLPGMVQYTPNQIFWITYGYSWCMKQTDDSMVKQLLTNPHAPAQCRTNNVVQDIPQFGRDFQCKVGSPMYPTTDQRCKVWVGP